MIVYYIRTWILLMVLIGDAVTKFVITSDRNAIENCVRIVLASKWYLIIRDYECHMQ